MRRAFLKAAWIAKRLDRFGYGNAMIGVAQSDVDGALRRVRGRGDRRRAPGGVEGLAGRDGRRAADEEMTKGEQALQSAADRLERLVSGARRSGGQLERPMSGRRSRRVSPWLVIGAAFAGGYLAAKVIDWRSHAHPR
jgi:hypothetical protein